MEIFTVIEDAYAIVRFPKGVFKQTKIYSRKERLYVPHAGGFIRILGRFGEAWPTSHPDIKVIEMDDVKENP